MSVANVHEELDRRGVPVRAPALRTRKYWFDARESSIPQKLLQAAQHQGFTHWLIQASAAKDFRQRSLGIGLALAVQQQEDLQHLSEGDVAFSDQHDLLLDIRAQREGVLTALFYTIHDADTLEESSRLGASHDFLIVDLIDETNIPLELVVAELQDSPTQVLKLVETAEAAEVSYGVVEHGADGSLLRTQDIEEIIALGESQQKRMTAQLDIQVGEITRIEHIGMGHRACIDVTSLMTREEGMLVGSTSSGGLLACSETHPLPYMDLRPFRVNVGAIHSYVWCPNNKTHYLSELKAGSKVFCVNVNGAAREVTVGRIKTEVRPLLLLEAKCGDVVVNAIVQDDWHVRVYGGDGEPVSVTTFQPGDPVLCYITKPGRHVGLPVDEQIIER